MTMIQNLTGYDLDPDELLEKPHQDARVLRLAEAAVRIGRSRASDWRGIVDDDVATLDPPPSAIEVVEALACKDSRQTRFFPTSTATRLQTSSASIMT